MTKVTCILLISCVFIGCPNFEGSKSGNLQFAKNIDPDEVVKITITTERLNHRDINKKALELSMKEDIHQFIHSLKSLKPSRLDHPQFLNEWLIEIKFTNNEYRRLKIMQETGTKKRLYVQLLGTRWYKIAEFATSKDLYYWMDERVGLSR